MKKIKQYAYNTILILLIILVAYVTYCSIFNIYKPVEDMKPLILIIGTIVAIFAFVNIKKIINKISYKKAHIIAITLCILFFVLLVLAGYFVRVIPGYDSEYVRQESFYMLENRWKIYK